MSNIYEQKVELPEPIEICRHEHSNGVNIKLAYSTSQVTKLIQEHMAKALEAAAKACDTLSAEHSTATGDCNKINCDFLAAWGDASEAIRNLIGKV